MKAEHQIHLLLFLITSFAFAFRFFLVSMNTYPPGSDIGLHQSVIASIMHKETSFFVNYYHMGGGLSVTNPGFHIFTSFIIAFTGMQDYIAQAFVASFFSAFLVPVVFLLAKVVWSDTVGLIAAILVTFSAGDIVILGWAGYPNIVTLSLIPISFYLLMKILKNSSRELIIATSFLVSAIFLTHFFSALVFMGITFFTLITLIFLRGIIASKKQIATCILSIGLGFTFVSPYLLRIIPNYFNSQGTITGNFTEINQVIIQTRIIPFEFLFLACFAAVLFLFYSKYKNKRYFTLTSIIFVFWIFVPIIASQTYLSGVYLDYQRFLYFLSVPIIVCIALTIYLVARLISKTISIIFTKFKRKTFGKPSKILSTIMGIILLFLFLFTPLFSLPTTAISQVNFFQVVHKPEFQAIQWIKNNTSCESVFAADAEFGWWLSGFAQRPTLSAVDPQFLILSHELEPANVARNLLKTST